MTMTMKTTISSDGKRLLSTQNNERWGVDGYGGHARTGRNHQKLSEKYRYDRNESINHYDTSMEDQEQFDCL